MGSFTTGMMDDEVAKYTVLDGHPETRIRKDEGPWLFDRNTKLGLDDRLDYNIIVNWLIAEHKSQGTMQMFLGNSGAERFWVYDINSRDAGQKAQRLMRKVQSGSD